MPEIETGTGTIHLSTAADLIASLPAQSADHSNGEITPQTLILLLLVPAERGWWQVERITQQDHGWFDAIQGHALTCGAAGKRAVAVIIDADADGAGDNSFEHSHLIRDAEYVIRGCGVRLDATYVARGVTAGEPVWSLDDDGGHGTVPEPPAAPPDTVYLIATPVTARPLRIVSAL